jgi:hypothetical protein
MKAKQNTAEYCFLNSGNLKCSLKRRKLDVTKEN